MTDAKRGYTAQEVAALIETAIEGEPSNMGKNSIRVPIADLKAILAEFRANAEFVKAAGGLVAAWTRGVYDEREIGQGVLADGHEAYLTDLLGPLQERDIDANPDTGLVVTYEGVRYRAREMRDETYVIRQKFRGDEMVFSDGWLRHSKNDPEIYKYVPASEVRDVTRTYITAMLGNVAVNVQSINSDRMAHVIAASGSVSSSAVLAPPHPLLERHQEDPYSYEWWGMVPFTELTGVSIRDLG